MLCVTLGGVEVILLCLLIGAAFGFYQVRSGFRCPDCGGKTCPNHGVRHVRR